MTHRSTANLIEAIELLESNRFGELIVPILKEREDTIVRQICTTDVGDEYNRGALKEIQLMLRMAHNLKEEVTKRQTQ